MGQGKTVVARTIDDNTRSYTFDEPLEESKMSWLNSSHVVRGYDIDGMTVTVTKTDQGDWNSIESKFLLPGFRKLFGEELNIETGSKVSA